MRRILLSLAGLVIATTVGNAQSGAVVKLDPALDDLVPADAMVEPIRGGFGFTEGPVWVPTGQTGYLLFSDIPANVIYKLTRQGDLSIYLRRTGYRGVDTWRVGFEFNNGKNANDPAFEKFGMIGSNGLALDPQGRLVVASFAGRSIYRVEPDLKRTIIADAYDGRALNGTNDVVVKRDGTVYFTDTFGSLRLGDKDPQIGILFQTVFMVKDGKVTRVTEDIPMTNGLAFSPDEKILYANGSRNKYIRAYDVKPDGMLTNSRMFIDMSKDTAPGITDGMKVDQRGNVYSTGPGGIWVIAPSGKQLGLIRLPEPATNLAFGDPDRKTIYITARSNLYKVRVSVPGI